MSRQEAICLSQVCRTQASKKSPPQVQKAKLLPPSDPDPTGKHPKSSVPAHIVEATLEDKDEDLIMLPAAKLEEWLKQGIRILRENRQRTKAVGSDPEYEALENEPGNPVSSPTRGPATLYGNSEKIVDPFFDRFEEISADSPSKITIDRNALSTLQLGDLDEFFQFGRFHRFENSESPFDILWQTYFSKLFESRYSRSVAHCQWFVTVRKAWFRRRFGAIVPSTNSFLVGICFAHMFCNGGTHGGDITIGSVLSYCFDSEVLSRGKVNDHEGIKLLAEIVPIFNDYMKLESDDPFSPNRRLLLWLMPIKTEEALALNVQEFMLIIRFLKVQSTFPINRIDSPSPTSLFINDLNFESLKEIGGLRLVWTDVLDEHLLLDHETRRLFVAFFGSIENSQNRS
ncbi:uncharacterized protein EAE97_009179 [Botrytis byssoidea]|uniref:Uncharacterized protein n=1 Tax=Botrytis byssoidea TaxID=139641 RepID=A0A9P5LZV8_9HELO|nr:uncharacterized protein EAE97_009179 [Botrytis byssoidea]KAF7930970.1 hypothetical protein EAE97_009179 [Botrytis byssoidea]